MILGCSPSWSGATLLTRCHFPYNQSQATENRPGTIPLHPRHKSPEWERSRAKYRLQVIALQSPFPPQLYVELLLTQYQMITTAIQYEIWLPFVLLLRRSIVPWLCGCLGLPWTIDKPAKDILIPWGLTPKIHRHCQVEFFGRRHRYFHYAHDGIATRLRILWQSL